jgi:hypothetical protein
MYGNAGPQQMTPPPGSAAGGFPQQRGGGGIPGHNPPMSGGAPRQMPSPQGIQAFFQNMGLYGSPFQYGWESGFGTPGSWLNGMWPQMQQGGGGLPPATQAYPNATTANRIPLGSGY